MPYFHRINRIFENILWENRLKIIELIMMEFLNSQIFVEILQGTPTKILDFKLQDLQKFRIFSHMVKGFCTSLFFINDFEV